VEEGIVTRIRGDVIPTREVGVILDLILGPTEGELTVEQLELAWAAYGDDVMRGWSPGRPGLRPWAFWEFDLREKQPEDEPIRLAELGLLRENEIAAIAERANEARGRIGTSAEVDPPDQRAVKLHEAILESGRVK
jgi:hypothetical protein